MVVFILRRQAPPVAPVVIPDDVRERLFDLVASSEGGLPRNEVHRRYEAKYISTLLHDAGRDAGTLRVTDIMNTVYGVVLDESAGAGHGVYRLLM